MTTTGYRFVAAISLLSAAHHLDHVARGVTGWPLEGGVNPFTISLAVYPVVAVGLLRTAAGRAGPRFWALLAGGGAVFVLVVHLGPAAGDSVTAIPDHHDSALAGGLAFAVLAALLAALVAHCAYETRQWARDRAA